ncbi:hypothetical protein ACFL2T_05565 [Elusimicrobiota bacterium]
MSAKTKGSITLAAATGLLLLGVARGGACVISPGAKVAPVPMGGPVLLPRGLNSSLKLPSLVERELTKRERALLVMKNDWKGYKTLGKKMIDAYVAKIAIMSPRQRDQAKGVMDEAWTLVEGIEDKELKRADRLIARLRTEEKDKKRLASRKQAVIDLFQLRMLFIHGNMVPRIVDEGVRSPGTTTPMGRMFAAPHWRMTLYENEFKPLHEIIKTRTGFPPEDLKSQRVDKTLSTPER